MPHTADPMGLIHKSKGPNNRFDFKNKGNNKGNKKTCSEKQVKKLKKSLVSQMQKVTWAQIQQIWSFKIMDVQNFSGSVE